MAPKRPYLLLPAVVLSSLALTGTGSISGAASYARPAENKLVNAGALRTAQKHALAAYGRLPFSFVPNAGRLDRRVRYSAQAGRSSFFFTRHEAMLVLRKGEKGLALRLSFPGANPSPLITGARRAPGRVNYLIGRDPSRWQTNLPTYKELVYHDLWPSVDLAFRGKHGSLKYEFRLRSGADPARIRLAYRGQRRLALGRRGELRIETPLGVLHDSRPVTYQQLGDRRVAVASHFQLGRGGAYGFALGPYDRRHPLVLDPGLLYSTYLGGMAEDNGSAIALDAAGSAYVTGRTYSANFPTTAGAFDTSFNGVYDAFVTKLNAAGSALAYSTYLGMNSEALAIAVGSAGSAYVTGDTGPSLPTTPGAFQETYPGNGDAFVTKLSADGSALAYSTYLGGSSSEEHGYAIAVDNSGSAYVTGTTESTDFPTTPGAFRTGYAGFGDAFVTKLNAAGSALAYSTYLGGGGDGFQYRGVDYGWDIAVDGAGSAYVTGETWAPNFPTTAGAFSRSLNGSEDAFVTKLNAAGSALVYSTYLGGYSGDLALGIAVEGAGSTYVSGATESPSFPTTAGAFDTSYNGGGGDAFVTKLNAAGSALAYSTYLGGGDREDGRKIAVDGASRAYVLGWTASTSFPTTPGAFDTSYNGGGFFGDAFVTKLSAAGSALVYSTYLGGASDDLSGGIAADAAGSAYVTGSTYSADFPTTPGAFDTSWNGGSTDAFVTRLDMRIRPTKVRPPAPPR